MRAAVDSGLKSMCVPAPQVPYTALSGLLSMFTQVMAVEVDRLIRAAPTKTSPLDILPISLIKQCSAELSTVIAQVKIGLSQLVAFPPH